MCVHCSVLAIISSKLSGFIQLVATSYTYMIELLLCMMSNRVVSNDRSGAYEDVFGAKKEVFAMKESPCYETVENVVKKNEERSSVNDHSSNIRKRLMCTLVIIITICILISMCGCLVFAFVEISRLKSEIIHIQQMMPPANETAFNEVEKFYPKLYSFKFIPLPTAKSNK